MDVATGSLGLAAPSHNIFKLQVCELKVCCAAKMSDQTVNLLQLGSYCTTCTFCYMSACQNFSAQLGNCFLYVCSCNLTAYVILYSLGRFAPFCLLSFKLSLHNMSLKLVILHIFSTVVPHCLHNTAFVHSSSYCLCVVILPKSRVSQNL